MKIVPYGEQILLKLLPRPERTVGSIFIPDVNPYDNYFRVRFGEVVALGRRAQERLQGEVKPGDIVVFPVQALDYATQKTVHATLTKLTDDEMHLLKWYDLHGVVTRQADGSLPEVR